MNIYVYVKKTEDISTFDSVMDSFKSVASNMSITTENMRCYRELDALKAQCNSDDAIVIGSLSSLGTNKAAISNQLEWFISKSVQLVICSYPPTYEYGISQPMNKAILTTILQSILSENKNIIEIPKPNKSNAGRNRMEFPDNWDDLYERWSNKEITSKEFINEAGLKKATFYNLLTEYKDIQESNNNFMKHYKII